MDEFFQAIISVARLIREGSEGNSRCIRVAALMVTFAVTVIAIAAGLAVLVNGTL